MSNYIILDSSIYRELGLQFINHIDYINLCGFAIATEYEVLFSTIVKEELFDFYKTNLTKKYLGYQKSIDSLKRDPFFDDNVSFSDISKVIDKSLEKYYKQLDLIPKYKTHLSILKHTTIDALELTRILLEFKNQEISNVQIRDYLIWDSVLQLALQESTDRIIKLSKRKITLEKGTINFITRDKIFHESNIFKRKREEMKISNIKIFHSIPEFLSSKGFNVSFLTEKLLINKISNEKIIRDLQNDIGALLSYVNSSYSEVECSNRKVELCEIEKKEIEEFYSYKEEVNGKFKYVVHLKVYVNVIFEKDSVETERLSINPSGLNTYDNSGRPVFKEPILFIYSGLLNAENKTIKSIKFIDFLPWLYITN
jgi:hypothetical protein